MDKYDYLLKKKIEKSLSGFTLSSTADDYFPAPGTKKSIARILTVFVLFPLIGAIGTYVVWTAVRLLAGYPIYASLLK